MAKVGLASFVLIVASLMVTAPVSAQTSTITDPEDDAFFSRGFRAPGYQDIVGATITFEDGEFTLVMNLAAPIPNTPSLPPKVILAAWVWNLNTDPTTFPAGWPFTPNVAIPPEFQIYLTWDGTLFSGFLADRRPLLSNEDVIITPVLFDVQGDEVTWSVDADDLDNPAGFTWKLRTIDWFGPFGSDGAVHLDAAPDDPVSASWPE